MGAPPRRGASGPRRAPSALAAARWRRLSDPEPVSTYEYSPSEEDTSEASVMSTYVSSKATPPWYRRPEDAAGGGYGPSDADDAASEGSPKYSWPRCTVSRPREAPEAAPPGAGAPSRSSVSPVERENIASAAMGGGARARECVGAARARPSAGGRNRRKGCWGC